MLQKIKKDNYFNSIEIKEGKELFDVFLKGKNFRVEKIISNGFKSSEKGWMIESVEEWVILLKGKAKIEIENGDVLTMKVGDFLKIPKMTKHRILYTSKKPFCYWLAIHFN